MTREEMERVGDALLKMAEGFDELEAALVEVGSRLAGLRAVYEGVVEQVMLEIHGE